MIIKAVTLFLVAIMVLGMFGKLSLKTFGISRKPRKLAKPRVCRKCKAPIVGKGTCLCSNTKSG